MLTIEAPSAQRAIPLARHYEGKPRDRFFDATRTMVTSRGKQCIREIANRIADYEMDTCRRVRRRRPDALNTFVPILDALVCDLLLASFLDDHKAIAVPRSNQELCKVSRYRPRPLGHQFPDVVDAMEELALLTLKRGYHH